MNKKVFKARNIQQALADIKEELGSDAIILGTRKVPKKPLDPYAKEMFEVEAAKPEENKGNQDRQNLFSRRRPHEGKLTESIRDEIAQIKDLISIAGFGSGMQNMLCNHFESVGVLASLLRAGISEKMAGKVMQQACDQMEKGPDRGGKIKSLKKYVMRNCMEKLLIKDFFNMEKGGEGPAHVTAFVGPTGVGKTTTIAKLAARLSFKNKLKIGLVSIDNYRIGAFEQLKSYASIMGLPCVQAYDKKDLANALDSMKSMDMVLMDTAGHSHFDKPKIDEIHKLIKGDFKISTHLVLSVTSESTIMQEAVSAFSLFNPETIVFTKTDETKRCGKILDHLEEIKLPVSIITNGQKVPEDLIIPGKRQLLKVIFGKESKEKD